MPQAWADDAISGTWERSYACGQGDTALTLILRTGSKKSALDGLFHFHESASACFARAAMTSGVIDPAPPPPAGSLGADTSEIFAMQPTRLNADLLAVMREDSHA